MLLTALMAPSIIARTSYTSAGATKAVMHVDVTYTEDAHITDKSKNENGAEEEDISNFSFRATESFERDVTMQSVAGTGVNFYSPENPNAKYSGAVSYNGEIKRTGKDQRHRTTLDEQSEISFAGVPSEESASDVPDDNAAGIHFGIQSNLTGECKGKRTFTSYIAKPGGEEKKVATSEINACGNSDELHTAAIITREPLNLDLSQLPDGKEVVHYAGQFRVRSCNLNPQYCEELKASEAAAHAVPNGEAMSDDWIGAITTGSIAQGFKINLAMFKELKVAGTWKRYLQLTATVMPVTKSRAALVGRPSRTSETADRLRAKLMSTGQNRLR